MITWLTHHSPHVHITHFPFPRSPASSPTFKASIAARSCGSQAGCNGNNPPALTALTITGFSVQQVIKNGVAYLTVLRGCSTSASDKEYPAQIANLWLMLNKPQEVTNGCWNMNVQMFPIYQNTANPSTIVFNSASCYPAAPSPTAVPTTPAVQGTPTAVPTAAIPTAIPTAFPTTYVAPTRAPTDNTFYCPPFSFEEGFSWSQYCELGIAVCPGQTITISGGASISECTGIQSLELDLWGDLYTPLPLSLLKQAPAPRQPLPFHWVPLMDAKNIRLSKHALVQVRVVAYLQQQ